MLLLLLLSPRGFFKLLVMFGGSSIVGWTIARFASGGWPVVAIGASFPFLAWLVIYGPWRDWPDLGRVRR